ncbi:MAG: iron-containing alcohol dehydrogenase [Melioribacteraceae bacterium]|nr:MAG: iron-containing alcohol dehydrogenase [Melioribacteraceae bacterium]
MAVLTQEYKTANKIKYLILKRRKNMKNFEFVNPTKILFGKGMIEKIGSEIASNNIKKVLLHYGKSSIFKNGVYQQVTDSLNKNGIEWIELGGVKPNPVLTKVQKGIDLCKNEKLEAVLAVGGGSVIDSAKAIAAGVLFDGNIWDAFEGKKKATRGIPIFTVLTLSATASEMNAFAVITKEDEKKKWAFSAGYDSFPRVTVIDPTVQMTLPVEQTINGAVDTMSHVFELYFDGTKNTDIQDEIAEGILRTTMKHVRILLANPDNYESRANLAWSATLALNGINGAGRSWGDWSTHTLEHSLSAFYDIAHGAGLSIMFPAWMKYVYKNDILKFAKLGRNVFDLDGDEANVALRTIDKVKEFFDEIGTPTSLKQINVTEKDLDKLTDNASLRAPIGNLVKLYRDDIKRIYELALI